LEVQRFSFFSWRQNFLCSSLPPAAGCGRHRAFQPAVDCIFMPGELHRCLFEVGIIFDVAEQRFKKYGSVSVS